MKNIRQQSYEIQILRKKFSELHQKAAIYVYFVPDTIPSYFRIMMMSVLKHTKSKVKFWFLKNYLSPSFKVSNKMRKSTFIEMKVLLQEAI